MAHPNDLDSRPLLDPEAVAALANFPFDLGSLSDETLPTLRATMAAAPPLPVSGEVDVTVHDVGGTDGVTVRVHRPQAAGRDLKPCVYWMHGGGMVLGSAAGDDARFDKWCRQLDIIGVSVEYRLAPETPYPGPMEDSYAGLKWTFENAASLGIDPARIGIGGASAGAGLAAGLALLTRDRGQVPLQFQLLIYPMIDDRQISPSSHWPDPVWPPSANSYGWGAYLRGQQPGGPDVPIYAAPARATDLAGLPATLISVGAIDGFSDEDIDYALRLRHAGVPVELHVYPGAPHGFDSLLPGMAISRRARRDMEDWLAGQVG